MPFEYSRFRRRWRQTHSRGHHTVGVIVGDAVGDYARKIACAHANKKARSSDKIRKGSLDGGSDSTNTEDYDSFTDIHKREFLATELQQYLTDTKQWYQLSRPRLSPGYIVLLTGTRKWATSALSRIALMDFLRSRFSFPKGSEGGSRPSCVKELGVSSGCAVPFFVRSFHSISRFRPSVQKTSEEQAEGGGGNRANQKTP